MDKEVRKLVQSLVRIPDVEVAEGGTGHLLVTKGGKFVVSLSATPSDHRWRDNAIAQLRRAGITPGVKPKKQATPPKVRQMDVVAELQPVREARQLAQFARFAQQLGEIRGLRTFASVESAENTIGNVARGVSGMRPWGWQLVMAALVEWRRRKPEPEVAHAVEPRPAQEQTPGVRLVVDLGRLVAKLQEFGIELEVR